MASVRSLYRKIQVVLDEAKRERASTLDELAENIQKRSPLNFTYFKLSSQERALVTPCKIETILKTLHMCVDLELIDGNTAKLTPLGKKATDSDYYESTLRQRIGSALKKVGTEIEEIERVIEKILSDTRPDRIPTWDVICDELNLIGLDRKKFHSYITLLSMSEGIGYSQKKIYLPRPRKGR